MLIPMQILSCIWRSSFHYKKNKIGHACKNRDKQRKVQEELPPLAKRVGQEVAELLQVGKEQHRKNRV